MVKESRGEKMKKLLMVLLMTGMLISTGGCDRDEPTPEPLFWPGNQRPSITKPIIINDTSDWITPDEKGWIWKTGYVPAKAIHEFISGICHGLYGAEPEKEQK